MKEMEYHLFSTARYVMRWGVDPERAVEIVRDAALNTFRRSNQAMSRIAEDAHGLRGSLPET
jgi:hypothetical protein